MSIGIMGAGALGLSLARAFSKAGISAVISNSRGPQSLAGPVKGLGPTITAGTTEEVARADIVFIAFRWADLKKVLGGLPNWKGRIVVDPTNPVVWIDPNSPDAKDPGNPLARYGIKALDLEGRQSSSIVAELLPGARLVKAFNHLDVTLLTQPTASGGKRVLFYSGDDAQAKMAVRALMEKIGFFPVDLGALEAGGPLVSVFGPLSNLNLIKI